jgi:hypothetical protein
MPVEYAPRQEIMRSGLQPVEILCNEGDYRRLFAAVSDVRAPSENTYDASSALRKADSMQENEFRGVGLLRSSHTRRSKQFASAEMATWQMPLVADAC